MKKTTCQQVALYSAGVAFWRVRFACASGSCVLRGILAASTSFFMSSSISSYAALSNSCMKFKTSLKVLSFLVFVFFGLSNAQVQASKASGDKPGKLQQKVWPQCGNLSASGCGPGSKLFNKACTACTPSADAADRAPRANGIFCTCVFLASSHFQKKGGLNRCRQEAKANFSHRSAEWGSLRRNACSATGRASDVALQTRPCDWNFTVCMLRQGALQFLSGILWILQHPGAHGNFAKTSHFLAHPRRFSARRMVTQIVRHKKF